jgi:hypothetical protein
MVGRIVEVKTGPRSSSTAPDLTTTVKSKHSWADAEAACPLQREFVDEISDEVRLIATM